MCTTSGPRFNSRCKLTFDERVVLHRVDIQKSGNCLNLYIYENQPLDTAVSRVKPTASTPNPTPGRKERAFFNDNLLVQIPCPIEMIWWAGLAPREVQSFFSGICVSTSLSKHTQHLRRCLHEGLGLPVERTTKIINGKT